MKLSIIVPTHSIPERGAFLQRSLDMLDKQTFRDFEIIVTSTGLGMAKNINAGIKQAKGEYIKFLLMDDYLADENSLQDIVDWLEISKADWLMTACSNHKNPHYQHEVCLGKNTVGSPSVITIKNDNPLLFDESMTWLVDCDYYRRLFERYGDWSSLNKVNVIIGEGQHQETHKIPQEVKEKELEYIKQKYA